MQLLLENSYLFILRVIDSPQHWYLVPAVNGAFSALYEALARILCDKIQFISAVKMNYELNDFGFRVRS